MKISKTTKYWLSAIALVLTLSSGRPAEAQVLITGRTAADNAASAGGRSPGDLATAGVGRALQAARDGRSIHTITEQEDTSTGPTGQLVASAGSAVVTQAFDFFFFFVNRLLVRGGLPPIFPAELTVPTTGGSAGDTAGEGTGGTPTTGGDPSGADAGGTAGTDGSADGGSEDSTGTGAEDTTGAGEDDTSGGDEGDTSRPDGGRRPVRKTATSNGQ